MQVGRYLHRKTAVYPVEAEIIQNEKGQWVGYIDGVHVGAFQKSHEALAQMRRIDARISNDLLGSHWVDLPISHDNHEGN